MDFKTFTYHTIIKEQLLDSFGHVNNAAYLVLLEEARWDLLTKNGYGFKVIHDKKIGPTILEINIVFKRELKLRDKIYIESHIASYEGKIATLVQTIKREGDEFCCQAHITMALFDMHARKLILPTPEWLAAVGKSDE